LDGALPNRLAVPDVRWTGVRIKAAAEGALERRHWPEPDAANDNAAVNSVAVGAA